MATTLDKITVKGTDIPLLLEEDHKLPIVSLQIIFLGSGSGSDGAVYGLSSLTADLLEEGTKKLGSVAFNTKLEEKAISLEFNAGKEWFSVSLNSLKEHFDDGVTLTRSLLDDPNLTAGTLTKIKNIALGDLSRLESNFDYTARTGLHELLFDGTPLAHPARGNAATVQKITLRQISDFLKSSLVQERAVVLVGGDITLKEAKAHAAKIIAVLPKGEAVEQLTFDASKSAETKLIKRETQQAYIHFGAPFNMPYDSNDSYKATVASFILGGGGFGSRLMEEVRVKRGLAYGAHSQIHLSHSSSYLSGELQTKLSSQDEAKEIVQTVVRDFVRHGATQQELSDARDFILGSEPLKNETMNQRLGRAFDDYYRKQAQGWRKEQLQAIKSLSLADLNAFLAQHAEINDISFFIITNDD